MHSPYPHIPCYHYQQPYLYFYPNLTFPYSISPLIPITLGILFPPYLHRTSTPPPPKPPSPSLAFLPWGGYKAQKNTTLLKKRAKLPLKSILFKKVYDYIGNTIKIVFRRYFVANRPIHNLRDNRFFGKADGIRNFLPIAISGRFLSFISALLSICYNR